MMRAGLIGLGMVAKTYGEAFRNSSMVGLARIYAPSPKSREGFSKEFSDLEVRQSDSIAEMAEDSRIDFVVLATPPNARIDPLHLLAEARKPVLMEKPIERTFKASSVIVEYCQAKEIPLGIMLQHRARPIVAELRKQVQKLGNLIAVEVNVPWWRPQSYYDEKGRGTYQRDGGGVMISQAIHTLDLMLTFTGHVTEVTAMSATSNFHKMEAEDFVVAGLRFDNGAIGQVFASSASFPGRGETITLHYQDGSAYLSAGSLTIEHQDGTTETFGQTAASGAGADPMGFTSDWHQTIIEDFADSIAKGREPMVPGKKSLAVHQLIDAIEEASRIGERIQIKEHFDAI